MYVVKCDESQFKHKSKVSVLHSEYFNNNKAEGRRCCIWENNLHSSSKSCRDLAISPDVRFFLLILPLINICTGIRVKTEYRDTLLLPITQAYTFHI